MKLRISGASIKRAFACIAIVCWSITTALADLSSDVLTRFKSNTSLEQLSAKIAQHVDQVEEFRFIQEEAAKLGIPHVYLFGGAAASYGNHVVLNELAHMGDTQIQKSILKYELNNMLRSNQDIDLVIDGTAEQQEKIKQAVTTRFPRSYGENGKSAWDVLSLQALKQDPDFFRQHSDSMSTGLIQIASTKSQGLAHAAPVQDLRELVPTATQGPNFLQDLRDRKIHYFFAPGHQKTERFLKGENPPVLSVVRTITKASQYELEIDPESMKQLKGIVEHTSLSHEIANPYIKTRFHASAMKMIENTADLEKTWKTLDQIGLRSKLTHYQDKSDPKTVSWWFDREPLRSVSSANPSKIVTARDLGLDIVAHETNSISAYEALMSSPRGKANFFKSRDNISGEAAVYGDGLYASIGKEGARRTGLTIRMKVDPNAVLGRDFALVDDKVSKAENGKYVRFFTNSHLHVIDEGMSVGSPYEFFRLLNEGYFQGGDRGVRERILKSIEGKLIHLPLDELRKIETLVEENLGTQEFRPALIQEWINLQLKLLDSKRPDFHLNLAKLVRMALALDPGQKLAITNLLSSNRYNYLSKILSKVPPHDWMKGHEEQRAFKDLVLEVKEGKPASKFLASIFGQSHWGGSPVQQAPSSLGHPSEPDTPNFIKIKSVLQLPGAENSPIMTELVEKLSQSHYEWVEEEILTHPPWKGTAVGERILKTIEGIRTKAIKPANGSCVSKITSKLKALLKISN
jgi:hypothetical protein